MNQSDKQACIRDKSQSETTRSANTRDKHMVKGKGKNISNRKLSGMIRTQFSRITASPGYLKIPEKQDSDLKITAYGDDRGYLRRT